MNNKVQVDIDLIDKVVGSYCYMYIYVHMQYGDQSSELDSNSLLTGIKLDHFIFMFIVLKDSVTILENGRAP